VVGYYNAGDYRRERRIVLNRSRVEQLVARLLTGLLERWSESHIAVDETGDWEPGVFLGGDAERSIELYRQVTPITHVGPHSVPTLQIVGEHDVYVGGSAAVAELHDRLRACGVPSVVLRLPRTDHAFDMFLPEVSPAAQTAMYHVDRFLALMAAPVDWTPSTATPELVGSGATLHWR
jgi:acetyl esterase/lipase